MTTGGQSPSHPGFPPALHTAKALRIPYFYHRFLDHGAKMLQPLNDMLTVTKEGKKELVWDDEATAAFTAVKEALAQATLLSHLVPDAPTSIMADASDTAMGAVLQQHIGNGWRLIAYFSKKLKPAETCYSAFDRELLAVYLAIRHFRYFVEGRVFCVLIDHKPLTFTLSSQSDRYTPRLVQHLDYISQFTTDIRHVKGDDNPAADALSRIAALQQDKTPVVNFQQMAAAQHQHADLLKFQSSSSSLTLKIVPFPSSDILIVCDMSTGTLHPFPAGFRRTVFDSLHSLSHPGIRATQCLITARYVWPSINADVRRWARACIDCQRLTELTAARGADEVCSSILLPFHLW